MPAVSYPTGSSVRCSTVRLGVGHAPGKHCQACADTLILSTHAGLQRQAEPTDESRRHTNEGRKASWLGEREVWRRGSLSPIHPVSTGYISLSMSNINCASTSETLNIRQKT